MITTHLRKLLAVIVCLLTGLTAQAQFKGAVEQYPTNNYASTPINFNLTEVATALSTDTATLGTVLKTYIAAQTPTPLFFVQQPDNTESSEPSADANGFWLSADGARVTWGESSAFYASPDVDVENDVFAFYVGQMPDVMKAGDKASAKIALKYNEKSVIFEIELNVIEKPVVDIPEPELAWGKLTIVDEITKDVTQKPRSGYDADKVEVDLTEALSKLGINGSLVQEELAQLLYAKIAYVTEDAVMGAQMSDSLTNESSAGAPGFWLRNFSDAEGNPTFECGRFAYNGDDCFFAEAFAFNAETGILSCNLGQMPNKLKGGNTYYADIFIVYGDKAIKIRYNLILPEVKVGTLEDYEKAGEDTIKVEMEPAESYDTKNFSIDIEAMTTALGCNVGEIDDFYMLDSEIDFASKNQEGVGYWVSMEGKVIGWGNDAMFYVTPKADDYSKFGIGQYPGHMNVGDSARATLYFVAGSKYYQLNVDLVIVAPKQVEVVFESVAQRAIEIQQVPGEYVWTSGVEIPTEWVEQQIGTSDWVLYALAKLNDDGTEKEGNERYSKSYTCTPYPGFWMDGEGRNVGWNQTPTRVGITVASPEGKFSLMQHPGVVLGDVFRFPIFLVNEENGKMVTFNFTYSIVESVVEIEEVGSTDIVLPVSVDEYGASTTVDLSDVLTAFNITLDALANGQYLHGITADGTYGSGVSLYDGLAFTDKGVCVQEDPFMFFDAELNEDGKSITVTSYAISEVAEDFSAIGTICFLLDGKRYVINVKFVSEAIFTGITEHHSVPHTSQSAVYDLQGRQVVKTQRGLYIQNGRKYMVK